MPNIERTLAYSMSKELTIEEISNISGAGTRVATSDATYNHHTGADIHADFNWDF